MIRQITEFKPRYFFLHSILDRLRISSNDGALRKRILWTKEVYPCGPSPLAKTLPCLIREAKIERWHKAWLNNMLERQ